MFVLFAASLRSTSVWKSSFRYVAIILERFLYSFMFIFKITILPDSIILWKPGKLFLDFSGQNVFKTSESDTKHEVILVISDFKILNVLESKE